MKAILLAGGNGTRLHPLTICTNKHLLPVYDKPMIYYSLSLAMLAGIRDVIVITTPTDEPAFRKLLGSGERFGLRLEYAHQREPNGLAEAFLIAEDWLAGDDSCLILGDNILWGHRLQELLGNMVEAADGARVFAYAVTNPSEYGVIHLGENGKAVSIEEKPTDPASNLAIPGMYFYDGQAPELARALKPSSRGELEITDLNKLYLERGQLSVRPMGRGIAWLDAGTTAGLLEASSLVRTLQERTSLSVACLEEIAWRNGWVSSEQVLEQAQALKMSSYGQYLYRLVKSREL